MPPKKSQAKITSSLKSVKPKSCSAPSEKRKIKNWAKEEAILRCFDLDINYGPIVGITRRDRLSRAEYFNLPVNQEVKNILNDPNLPSALNLNMWHDLENVI